MDAIECMLTRNAYIKLTQPAPNEEERELIFKAALRAPDHARLKPWRFVSFEGDSRRVLGECFLAQALKMQPDLSQEKQHLAVQKGYRAPWIVAVLAKIQAHPKVPEIEQCLSAGAAAQSMILAAHALGYGAVWRTGDIAYAEKTHQILGLESDEKIIGFLYIGTPNQTAKAVPQYSIADFVRSMSN